MDRGAWWATVWGGNKLGHDVATKQQQQRWVEKFFIFPRADSTSKAHLQKEKLMWLSFAEMWKPRKALAQQRQGTDGEGAQTPFPGQPHMGSFWRWSTSRRLAHPQSRPDGLEQAAWGSQAHSGYICLSPRRGCSRGDIPHSAEQSVVLSAYYTSGTMWDTGDKRLNKAAFCAPSQSQKSPRNRQLSHNWAGFPPNLQSQEANPNLFFQSSLFRTGKGLERAAFFRYITS